MNNFVKLNLELYKPTVNEAIEKFIFHLNNYKKNNIKCIYIIHGYGSHGKGGLIRDAIRKKISTLKEQNLIKTYIYGEDFNILNNTAYQLKQQYKELEHLFHMKNKGVTIVLI